MAENEQLDASRARKWRAVARAIAAGADSEAIAGEVERTFCQALRDIKNDGDLPGMIRGLANPKELDGVLAGWEGDPLVAEFIAEAAQSDGSLERRIEEALEPMLGNCLYDVPRLAAEGDPPIAISLARYRLKLAMFGRRPDIVRRIAEKLAANPDGSPQARARKSASKRSDFGSTEQMLNESLLKGPN